MWPPINCIEINTRRHRNAGIGQNAIGKSNRIIGQSANIGIEIKGPIWWRVIAQKFGWQAAIEKITIFFIARNMRIKFIITIKGGNRAKLVNRCRWNIHILRQHFGGWHQIFGKHHPTKTPASHAEIFRKRIDDDGIVSIGKRALGSFAKGQAMIDFIHDQAHTMLVTPAADGFKLVIAHHNAGWICRTCQQQPIGNVVGCNQWFEIGYPVLRGTGGQQLRFDPKRQHQIEIGRISGRGDGNTIALVKGR